MKVLVKELGAWLIVSRPTLKQNYKPYDGVAEEKSPGICKQVSC
jgi:hypothetical protein